jgi:membrane-associated phospholipid phosphatase
MFGDFGFVDSLGTLSSLNHGSGLIQLAANPYAAMPSLHAADALIVGITLAALCRNRIAKVFWYVWPAWVWFAVMATGNHFWLDVLGGVLVAVVAMVVIGRRYRRREETPAAAAAAQ